MFQIQGWRPLTLGGCVMLIISGARPADAQPRAVQGPYVTVSALTDVKRFSGDPDTNVLDGNAFGGAVTIGTPLGTRWDVEVGVSVPRTTEDSEARSLTIRREIITLQSRTTNRVLGVTAIARFRSARHGRLQVGYLGGLTFIRLQRQFDTVAPPGTPDSLIPRPQELLDYGAAPTIGIDASIALGTHLSIVPVMHVSAFSVHDVSGILLSPGIGARWTF